MFMDIDTPTQRYLAALGACFAAREWVGYMTIHEAAARCERTDWLHWLAVAQAEEAYSKATHAHWVAYLEGTHKCRPVIAGYATPKQWAEYDREITRLRRTLGAATAPHKRMRDLSCERANKATPTELRAMIIGALPDLETATEAPHMCARDLEANRG